MITTTDQDRHIEARSIALGADRVEVAAIGPASVKAVLARYRNAAGLDETERVAEDGTATPVPTRYARPRWIRYAGRSIAALAIAAALVPGAAIAKHRHPRPQDPPPCFPYVTPGPVDQPIFNGEED